MAPSFEIRWADSFYTMLIASSTGSCSGLASTIVLPESIRLTEIFSLPTSSWSVARFPLGLTSSYIGWPIKKSCRLQGYRRCGNQGRSRHVKDTTWRIPVLSIIWPSIRLRFFQDFLWCSVPNSAKECSGRWYYQRICTSSIHSLLTIALRPSNCDVASRMDASNLEHMYLCSFDIAEFHILLWRGQEWTLTYTSMGGSWSVDLVGSVVSYMWWRWRGCSW